MRTRDVMNWNVVSVSSDTLVMEARKLMDAHKILRLPVVDKGKLVGIVTKDRILRAGPSTATSLSVWEVNYLLAKMVVKDIMIKDPVTVSLDESVEHGIAYAQAKGVGSLLVMDDQKLVGIVTTNDFFYKILNPLLGIGEPGIRFSIANGAKLEALAKITEAIRKFGIRVIAFHTMPPLEGKESDLRVHLDTEDATALIKELESMGYAAYEIDR